MLSTINKDGGVSSRLIQPFEIEGDSENPEIFFNTNLLSRKASEMSMNPKVSLTYVNGKRMSYVCWQGDATRVSSPDHKKHWREWLRCFTLRAQMERDSAHGKSIQRRCK